MKKVEKKDEKKDQEKVKKQPTKEDILQRYYKPKSGSRFEALFDDDSTSG